jgi:hypothetical protein
MPTQRRVAAPDLQKNVAQDAIDDSVGAHYVASALLVCEMQE